jgi:hypothetical protein
MNLTFEEALRLKQPKDRIIHMLRRCSKFYYAREWEGNAWGKLKRLAACDNGALALGLYVYGKHPVTRRPFFDAITSEATVLPLPDES